VLRPTVVLEYLTGAVAAIFEDLRARGHMNLEILYTKTAPVPQASQPDALRLDPRDPYVPGFLGTIYLLEGINLKFFVLFFWGRPVGGEKLGKLLKGYFLPRHTN